MKHKCNENENRFAYSPMEVGKNGQATQKVVCLDCGEQWEDTYAYVGDGQEVIRELAKIDPTVDAAMALYDDGGLSWTEGLVKAIETLVAQREELMAKLMSKPFVPVHRCADCHFGGKVAVCMRDGGLEFTTDVGDTVECYEKNYGKWRKNGL